jgi:membrane protein
MVMAILVRNRLADTLVVRVARRTIAIDGYDRALALAAQAFVALAPLLLVVAAVSPAAVARATDEWVDVGSIDGGPAAVLAPLVLRPPGGRDPVTVLGILLVIVSVAGFTRTLQRTFVAAWCLPRPGLRGVGWGLLGAAVLVAEVVALVRGGALLRALPNAPLLTATARVAPSILLWWTVQWLLLGRALSWRALFPGAVASGLGQVVFMLVSGLYLPVALAQQATRYGLIGMAVVLVSWLVVLGLLLVLAAALGAELRGRPTP